jgi:N-glycosylase/DNA lyase
MKEFLKLYDEKKSEIINRLNEFKEVFKNGSDEDIFKELSFCLFTPQSKAQNCWKTVLLLEEKDLLLKGDYEEVLEHMNLVRFKYKKTRFLLEAREFFKNNHNFKIKDLIKKEKNVLNLREYFVNNIKGLSFKEASHFLRNIGFGEKLAIIDRHILRFLVTHKIIDDFPKTITKKIYLEIEKKIEIFSKKIKIPMDQLDLLIFFTGNGEIFK